MSVLKNPKHELFAQALAKGSKQIAAYEEAGYKPNAAAASKLQRIAKISERVQELLYLAAQKTTVTIADVVNELLMRSWMLSFVCSLEAAGRLVWSMVTLWQKIRDHGERPRTKPTMPPVMAPPIM